MNSRESHPVGAIELTEQNAPFYLRGRNEYRSADRLQCRELGGGVSNTVLLVETPHQRFVVKQALPQLRVKDEWLADRSRIFRERDGFDRCRQTAPTKSWVPEVLWSDEPNYLFAMQAAEEPNEFWKNRLLSGVLEPEWARRAGMALGLTIRGSWRSELFERKYGDRTAFDQLRTDPYYRTIALPQSRHCATLGGMAASNRRATALRLRMATGARRTCCSRLPGWCSSITSARITAIRRMMRASDSIICF